MASIVETDDYIETVTEEEGRLWVDREAREFFGISGDEFIRKYRNADVADLFDRDPSALSHLSLLLPLAGVALDAWKESQTGA